LLSPAEAKWHRRRAVESNRAKRIGLRPVGARVKAAAKEFAMAMPALAPTGGSFYQSDQLRPAGEARLPVD
ncbi:MAG: hypothetical protein QOI46_3832, partial [Alphaproteobacteria bacterium]|nr:hypothetical protein [Alphaproteobacteria bacterium]